MRKLTSTLVATTILLSLSEVSIAAAANVKPKVAEQKIAVEMTDIKYSVKRITVKKGVPVLFTFVNKGKAVHEAVIGTRAHQLAHDKEMAAMGSMVMPDEPTAISLKPGVTKQLRYTFTKSGTYEVGCHTPGHYGAGMKIDVVVS